MARINLRPWRDEIRAESQRQFITAVAAVAIFGVLYVFVADRITSGWIGTQEARNSYLNQEIAKLEDDIKEISQLREKREQLIERMRVIQELQGNRPVIVRIFDELVRQLPDGVHFTTVTRENETISITGRAESNNRISTLMRQLDGSEWFEEPNLTSVKASEEEDAARQLNDFDLSVLRSTSEASGEEG